MQWVPTNEDDFLDESNRPRYLTEEEKLWIAMQFPTVPCSIAEDAELERESFMEWILQTLDEIELCPNMIPVLAAKIVDQYSKSIISTGTTVGANAAEAVGSIITQMTLNTFHTSGSAKSASFGIGSMKDLIFARKNIKNESCFIYFKDKTLDYAEALNSRKQIIGSVIKDFVTDYDIDHPDTLSQYWWHSAANVLIFHGKPKPKSQRVMRLFLNVEEMYKHGVTISQLAKVLENDTKQSMLFPIYGPISDGILDLYPENVVLPPKKGKPAITAAHIMEQIFLKREVYPKLKDIRVKGISGIRQIYPVVFPVWSIVSVEREMSGSDMLQPSLAALRSRQSDTYLLTLNKEAMKRTGLTKENLSALLIAAGITDVYAMPRSRYADNRNENFLPEIVIVVMPRDEYATGRYETDYGDKIIVSNDLFYIPIKYNVIDNVYYELLEESRIIRSVDKILYKTSSKVKVTLNPEDIINVSGDNYYKVSQEKLVIIGDIVYKNILPSEYKIVTLKPSEYVAKRVKDETYRIEKETRELTNLRALEADKYEEPLKSIILRKPLDIKKSALIRASEFIFLETDGSNLKELLAQPFVDSERTYCNNMYNIAELFGIEAARTYLLTSLVQTIQITGGYVHHSHLLVIAEFITNRGEPRGATFTGVSGAGVGHLSLSTLQRGGLTFTNSAFYGKTEDIRGVSASIAVGARCNIGNGSFDIACDTIENGQVKTYINGDVYKCYNNDDRYKDYINPSEDHISDETIPVEPIDSGIAYDYNRDKKPENLTNLYENPDNIPQMPHQQQAARTVKTSVEASQIVKDLNAALSPFSLPLAEGESFIQPIKVTNINLGRAPQIYTKGLKQEFEFDSINYINHDIPAPLADLFDEYFKFRGVISGVSVPMPAAPLNELPDLDFDFLLNVTNEISNLDRENLDIGFIDVDKLQENL